MQAKLKICRDPSELEDNLQTYMKNIGRKSRERFPRPSMFISSFAVHIPKQDMKRMLSAAQGCLGSAQGPQPHQVQHARASLDFSF